MTEPKTRRLLKTRAAADYLSCSTWKLRDLVHEEKIPHIVIDANAADWRFDIRDLDAFIDACRETTA